MSGVCFACGLTTDSSGNLIVNTNSANFATDFASCSESAAGKIYCLSDGHLGTAPDSFVEFDFVTTQGFSGSLEQFAVSGIPIGGTSLSPLPGATASFSVTNPSPCRTMALYLRVGVNHADFHSFTTGASRVEISGNFSASGALSFPASPVGHQIWGATTNGTEMDSTGAYGTRLFILPAASSVTFTVQTYMTIFSSNGNTTLTNVQTYMECFSLSL